MERRQQSKLSLLQENNNSSIIIIMLAGFTNKTFKHEIITYMQDICNGNKFTVVKNPYLKIRGRAFLFVRTEEEAQYYLSQTWVSKRNVLNLVRIKEHNQELRNYILNLIEPRLIFAKGIPMTMNKYVLGTLLSKYGKILYISIVSEKDNEFNHALIEFDTHESAMQCRNVNYIEMEIKNHWIMLEWARPHFDIKTIYKLDRDIRQRIEAYVKGKFLYDPSHFTCDKEAIMTTGSIIPLLDEKFLYLSNQAGPYYVKHLCKPPQRYISDSSFYENGLQTDSEYNKNQYSDNNLRYDINANYLPLVKSHKNPKFFPQEFCDNTNEFNQVKHSFDRMRTPSQIYQTEKNQSSNIDLYQSGKNQWNHSGPYQYDLEHHQENYSKVNVDYKYPEVSHDQKTHPSQYHQSPNYQSDQCKPHDYEYKSSYGYENKNSYGFENDSYYKSNDDQSNWNNCEPVTAYDDPSTEKDLIIKTRCIEQNESQLKNDQECQDFQKLHQQNQSYDYNNPAHQDSTPYDEKDWVAYYCQAYSDIDPTDGHCNKTSPNHRSESLLESNNKFEIRHEPELKASIKNEEIISIGRNQKHDNL